MCLLHSLPRDLRFSSWKILILLKILLSCDYYNRNKRTATCDHVVIYIFFEGGGWGIWRKPTCQQCKYFPLLCNVNINDLKHFYQDNPTILSNILENPLFSKF
jgi:hypothetical protein